MFVITGATGNTGGVVARQLLDAGRQVRVLVRDPARARALADRGAEVVTGDVFDEAELARAAAGAEGLYLLSPPDMRATDFVTSRRLQMEAAIRAARKAGVGHVVLLSSIGAQHVAGTGPVVTVHNAEQALRATGLPVTFVRAAYFVTNWGAVLPAARQDGVLPSFIPAAASIPMVDTRDVGAAAARALLDGPRGTRVIEVAGPQEVSPGDVAAAVGRVLSRPIQVVEAPLEAVVPTFTSFGISENVAGLYREMFQAIRSGKLAWEGGQAELVRGTTTIEQTLTPMLTQSDRSP
jgi:uncharacterized protein YbjT (DUF2867 family)